MKYQNAKLKARIKQVFGSHKNFADELGITIFELYEMLDGAKDMELDEIDRWAKLLSIRLDEMESYFFIKA